MRPFVSPQTHLRFKQFLAYVKGIIVIASAALTGVCVWFYHPLDPCFHVATQDAPRHPLGIIGSYLSDILFQMWGRGAYVLSGFIAFCGIRLLLQKPFSLTDLLYGTLSLLGICLTGTFLDPSLSSELKGYLSWGLWGYYPFSYLPVFSPTTRYVCVLITSLGALGFFIPFFKIPLFAPSLRFLRFRTPKSSSPKPPARAKKRPTPPPEGVLVAQETSSSYEEIVPTTSDALPPLELLDSIKRKIEKQQSPEVLQSLAKSLEDVLQEFGVRGEIVNIRPGPVVTMFEFRPAPGIKTSRVIGLSEDIARSMSALSARIAVIPGQNVIGIELPNVTRETVYLRELLDSPEFENFSGRLPLILGKDIGGKPMMADLSKMPHLLVAGTTGSGKSVSVNVMILSVLFKMPPSQCRFIMVDPKMLELSIYDGIPHLLCPVVTDPKKAVVALKWAVKEMENRYRLMSQLGVRNIDGYNTRLEEAQKGGEILQRRVQTGFDSETGKPIFEHQVLDYQTLPYIVVVVDEMADLMLVAGKEIEGAVQRLAQMARAAGIHLIMATQRPSVDVITGTIKANFPTRISFQVTSKIDSRTILGEQGAEQLLGQGDMLYMIGGGRISRVHGPYVKDEEVERVVRFLKQQGEPTYIDAVTEDSDEETEEAHGGGGGESDDLYQRALEVMLREGKISTSFLQRHLQLGYNRAAKIVELMEKRGRISPPNHAGKREILG